MSLGLPVVPGGFIAEFASPPWQCSHLVGWLRTSRTLARYAYAPDEFYAELVPHGRDSHLVGSLRTSRMPEGQSRCIWWVHCGVGVAVGAPLMPGRFAADFTQASRSVLLHLVGSLRSWRCCLYGTHAW